MAEFLGQNVTAGLYGILVTSIITFLFARFGKSWDARGQAEAMLIGIGPKIIEEQNRRIGQLSDELNKLWQQEHECRTSLTECKASLTTAERRIASIERRVGKMDNC